MLSRVGYHNHYLIRMSVQIKPISDILKLKVHHNLLFPPRCNKSMSAVQQKSLLSLIVNVIVIVCKDET